MIRVGIVDMSSDHVWAMGDGLAAQPEVEMVAVAERYPELRARGVERWKLGGAHADLASMLKVEQLDALMLCGNNAGKAEIVEAAAKLKLHVYSDKPMGATLADADRIVRAVESSGITYMCAYHSAFNPVYDQIRSLLQGGAIGTVYLARGVTGHGGPREFGCSDYFCEWLFDRSKNGGGTFVDEACYLLDGFIDYLGAVGEVSAFTTQIGHRDYLPVDVEDNAVAILRFKSGALGVIDAKWGQVGPAPVRTSFHGTQGTITTTVQGTHMYSTANPPVPDNWGEVDTASLASFGRAPVGLRAWRAPDVPRSSTGSAGVEQRRFVDCVLAGQQVDGPASAATARRVQEAIDAVYKSAASGVAVKLPL